MKRETSLEPCDLPGLNETEKGFSSLPIATF
jgi:hypothetical protein